MKTKDDVELAVEVFTILKKWRDELSKRKDIEQEHFRTRMVLSGPLECNKTIPAKGRKGGERAMDGEEQ